MGREAAMTLRTADCGLRTQAARDASSGRPGGSGPQSAVRSPQRVPPALENLLKAQAYGLGFEVAGRAYVDTGPVLERDLARRAGLGWFGKNTMLVSPGRGSFFFLGCLLVKLELEPDAPFEADRCGTCTRCLDACPTGAITAPRELDATRCVSYLTIELKGAIPEELRAPMGELLYGCDVCQDVCPWNVRFAAGLPDESPYQPREALSALGSRLPKDAR